MDTKKLFVVLLMGIFMISMVSAFDFDNFYEYNGMSEKADIYNCDVWAFTCLSKGDKLATLELTLGDTVVPAGKDILVGSFKVTFEDGHTDEVFDNLGIIDLKNGGVMTRGKQYKWKDYKEATGDPEIVPVYTTECTPIANGTWAENGSTIWGSDCEQVFSHNEMVYPDQEFEWRPISNPNFQFEAGVEYEVGVFVDVEVGDHGDWYPDLMGVQIREWAEFTQSTAVDLISYYRFDETNNLMMDEEFDAHFTNTGSTNTSGYIGSGRDFDGTNDELGRAIGNIPTGNSARSFNFWFNYDTLAGGNADPLIAYGTFASTQLNIIDVNANNLRFWGHSADLQGGSISTGTWYMGTVTHDGTTTRVYVDGLNVANATQSLNTGSSAITIGHQDKSGAEFSDVKMDEIGIWSRALDSSEVTELYNSDTGLQNPRNNYTWDLNTDAGLKNYYKFDEQDTTGTGTIIDEMGDNNATNSGADNFTGKLNTGYDFDGSSDIDFTGNIALQKPYTVNIWFNAEQTALDRILDYTYGSYNDPVSISLESGDLDFCVGGSGSYWVCAELHDSMDTGNWHMVTVTNDGSTAKGYLDGVYITSTNHGGTHTTSTSGTAYIGSYHAEQWFDGQLDEFGVWHRELTADEVKQLFNYTNALVQEEVSYNWTDTVDSNIASYYTFDTDGEDELEYGNATLTQVGIVSGKQGNAVDCANSSSKVDLATNGYDFTGDFSANMWIKGTKADAQVLSNILRDGSNYYYGWDLNLDASGKFRAEIGTGTGSTQLGTSSTNAVNDDAWHMLTMVFDDSTNIATTYVDGIFENSDTLADPVYHGTKKPSLCGWYYNSGSSFDPKNPYTADEVSIWATALDDYDVWQLYNNSYGMQHESVAYFWNSYDLSTDLVSYYEFEDDLTDSYGSNDLTDGGSITFESGIVGQHAVFDGSTDYAYKSSFTDLVTGDGARSLCLWATPDADATTSYITSYGTEVNHGLWTVQDLASDKMGLGLYFDDLVGARTIVDDGANSYHVCITHDGTTQKIYVNGVMEDSGTSTLSTSSSDFVIGRYVPNSAEWYDGDIDELGYWDGALNDTQIWALYNNSYGLEFNSSVAPPTPADTSPTITGYNVSANYSATGSYDFVYEASDDVNLDNVSVYVNGVLNQTDASGTNATNYTFSIPLGEGTYTILGSAVDNASQQTNTSEITIIIDATAPTLTIFNPLNASVWQNKTNNNVTVSLDYTATDTYLDACWYSDGSTNTTFGSCANATYQFNSSVTGDGSITFTFYANDTFGNEILNATTFYVNEFTENTYGDASAVEGFAQTITLNLTTFKHIDTLEGNLTYGGTVYPATQDSKNLYVNFITPSVSATENKTWNFTYILNGETFTTDDTNQTVYDFNVNNCSTGDMVILNFSLYDEEDNDFVNGSAGTNIEVDVSMASYNNVSISRTYSNTWTNSEYAEVCIPDGVLNASDYQINFTVGFDSTDRVWEFYYLDNGNLSLNSDDLNTQTTKTPVLYDLLTADSTSFLFNYFDTDGLAVDGSMVHVYRKYIGEGTFREVERAKADQNGDTIIHLVEEDVIYYFVISLNGEILFTSSQYTALCQATPCTIQIEASGSGAEFDDDWDLVDGGAYTITSDADARTTTLTYSSDTASTWNYTVYKYESDGSYTALNTSSATGVSGSQVLSVPLSAGNVSFFATVHHEDEFINSEWVDFENNPQDAFGTTLSLFIAGLLILCLGLMAVTEGGVVIVWVLLGVVVSGFLGLITVDLSTGVSVLTYLILAGGIILWKLTRRRD